MSIVVGGAEGSGVNLDKHTGMGEGNGRLGGGDGGFFWLPLFAYQ